MILAPFEREQRNPALNIEAKTSIILQGSRKKCSIALLTISFQHEDQRFLFVGVSIDAVSSICHSIA